MRMNVCWRNNADESDNNDHVYTVLDALMENIYLQTKFLSLGPRIESSEFHYTNEIVAKRNNQFNKVHIRKGRIDAEAEDDLGSDTKNFTNTRETTPLKTKHQVIPSYQMECSRLFWLTVKLIAHEGMNRKFLLRYWMSKINN